MSRSWDNRRRVIVWERRCRWISNARRNQAWETIGFKAHDGGAIVTLTLQRPEALNAINRQMAKELAEACARLADNRDVHAVIVTGAGERAFCAGADLKERRALTASERAAHTAEIEAAAEALAALPMPTIAALRGYALAGGSELAVACDLRVAGDDAVLGFPEVKIGIFPGAGGVRGCRVSSAMARHGSPVYGAANQCRRGISSGTRRSCRRARGRLRDSREPRRINCGQCAAGGASRQAGADGELRSTRP